MDHVVPPPKRRKLVIVGGGFGGLYAARALADAPIDITLVDRRNHHLFQPLLYQVATAALDPSDIASPLRQIFGAQDNVTVLLGDCSAIEPAEKWVIVDGEAMSSPGWCGPGSTCSSSSASATA